MPTDPAAKPKGAPPSGTVGHETTDAHSGRIFGIVAFLAILGVIIQFLLGGMLTHLKKRPAPKDTLAAVQRPAPASLSQTSFPHLQTSAPADLAAFRALEEAQLNSYGWVNKTAGVV